jgi:hypothetical protein
MCAKERYRLYEKEAPQGATRRMSSAYSKVS